MQGAPEGRSGKSGESTPVANRRQRLVTILAMTQRPACQLTRLPLELICAVFELIQGRDYALPVASEGIALPGHAQPCGIAVTPQGDIVAIADRAVHLLRSDGTLIRSTKLSFLPSRVTVDHEGRILVSDFRANRVWVLNEEGVPVASARVSYPAGSAELIDGNYVVTDMFNDQLHFVSRTGVRLRTTAEDFLRGPCSVAVNSDGDIAIGELGNCRVHVLRRDLTSKRILGGKYGPGKLRMPAGVAFDHAGNIVVADGSIQAQGRVVVFSPEGDFMWQHPVRDPNGVAVLPDGRIAVGDGIGMIQLV